MLWGIDFSITNHMYQCEFKITSKKKNVSLRSIRNKNNKKMVLNY